MKKLLVYFFLLSGVFFSVKTLFAQSMMKSLHGEFWALKTGVHDGNQFCTTFFNDGTLGTNFYTGIRNGGIAGEWPVDSGHLYLTDGNPFVASEVIDANGEIKHISSTVMSVGNPNLPASTANWSRGDVSPAGEWRTFLPLPGFTAYESSSIAMNTRPDSWPAFWPNRSDDPVDPGWQGKWCGYFGKNVTNADEESFFVADDYQKREFLFYPDSLNTDRRGLGMRMYVRGMQWSSPPFQDILVILIDIENIGTYNHNKAAFGYKIGNGMGDTGAGLWDGSADAGDYLLDEDIAYLYDFDNIGAGGPAEWPNGVGYMGAGFLETPGNPVDGIDNDNDGTNGSGQVITEALFQPWILKAGELIVLVDYKTFQRTVIFMPNDTLRIRYSNLVIPYAPGMTLIEIPDNQIDDNLNGIIDENNGTQYGAVNQYLYTGLKYIDYINGYGLDNPMIDERRDDAIDNDGDWNVISDDVGVDGAPFTWDPGERNGMPTSGEPHFDRTDIHETDMIGLTGFNLYAWAGFAHDDDEAVWEKLKPGKLDNAMTHSNVELLLGSGYFPIRTGEFERFSIALILDYQLDGLMIKKNRLQGIVAENYSGMSGIEEGEKQSGGPDDFALLSNFPNPFNSFTEIPYNLARPASVEMSIYNQMGQRVRTFQPRYHPKGKYQVVWDGKNDSGADAGSGVYFCTLRAGGSVRTNKLMLLR